MVGNRLCWSAEKYGVVSLHYLVCLGYVTVCAADSADVSIRLRSAGCAIRNALNGVER